MKKAKHNDVIKSSPDKTEWVQLKSKVPRPLRSKIKAEAANLDESVESYLLKIYDDRHETYLKLLAQKELAERTKRAK